MWDMLTTAITVSNADESKQLKSSMPFLKNGQSEGHMFGYQYLVGQNFPVMYQKVERQKIKTMKTKHAVPNGSNENNETNIDLDIGFSPP